MPKAKWYDESYKYYPESAGVVVFYCPGCKGYHYIHTKEKNSSGAMWAFNGLMDSPTFSPSIHIHYTDYETQEHKTICHSFVRDGQIQYLTDCRHDLKGQTIDLPDLDEVNYKPQKIKKT